MQSVPRIVVALAVAGLGVAALGSAACRQGNGRDAALVGGTVQASTMNYSVKVERNVRVPMRDGTELSADVFRPDAEGRFPVLIIRSPYGKDWSAGISGGPYEAEPYVRRGYVVVQQDCRGTYDSRGTFEPFVTEAADGFDTDAWAARQPWSNGKIAGLGQSYYGLTQLAQATAAHPSLVTIAPVMTTSDTYNNWIYSDGAFHLGFAMNWGIGLAGPSVKRPDPRIPVPMTTATASASNPVFRHLPLLTMDEESKKITVPYYRDWMAHPTRDGYWNGRSYGGELNKVAVPGLFFTGWYDFFLRGALADFSTIRREGATATARNGTRLVVGPWAHYTGPQGATQKVGDVDFGASAAYDLPNLLIGWYERWMKPAGQQADGGAPVRLFVMGDNRWRDESDWPLAGTLYTKYYLSSQGKANTSKGDGMLSLEAPRTGQRADAFAYDPQDPVPTIGGVSGGPTGPRDQTPLSTRQDILTYQTAPLTERVEVTGPIRVTLYAATSAKDTDFTAKLIDVHPDGIVQNLQDGIVRARYRKLGQPAQPINPGAIVEYSIDLWATSNAFLPGHRIRVDISSSNFPHWDRNLNTGDDPASDTNMIKAWQSVYHDADHTSHILLPVIPNGSRPAPTN
jgi:putative CocE/NonD family hydrolase